MTPTCIADSIMEINRLAASWADSMLRACWQGGFFCLVVWALCRLLPRLQASLRCSLWWLVCLKLPVSLAVASPLALPLLPSAPPPAAVILPSASPSDSASSLPRSRGNTLLPSQPLLASTQALAPPQPLAFSLASLFLFLWAAGVLLRLSMAALPVIRLHFLALRSRPPDEPALLAQAREMAAGLGLRRIPRLLLSERDLGPLTLGLGRPLVLLSRSDLARLSEEERRVVLAHEFAHIRRHDLWLGLFPQLAQILFWFYPLAWLAGREFDLAREAACDARTVQCVPVALDAYGRLLLKLGTTRNAALPQSAPGVSAHYRTLQRRIAMLQHLNGHSSSGLHRRQIALCCFTGFVGIVPWCIVRAQQSLPQQPAFAVSAGNRPAEKPIQALSALPTIEIPQESAEAASSLHALPGAVLPALISHAPQGAPDENDGPVTFHGVNMPFEQALQALFRSCNLSYRIDPAVTAKREPVSFEVDRVKFDDALLMLLSSIQGLKTPLTYRLDDGVYVILPAKGNTVMVMGKGNRLTSLPLPVEEGKPALPTRSAFLFLYKEIPIPIGGKLSVSQALRAARVDQDVTIEHLTHSDTGSNKIVPPTPAGQDSTFLRAGDILIFTKNRQASSPKEPIVPSEKGNPSKTQNQKMMLDFQNTDLAIALRLIFMRAESNYIYADPLPSKQAITLSGNFNSMNDAVLAALRSAKADSLVVFAQENLITLTQDWKPGEKGEDKNITLLWKDLDAFIALSGFFKVVHKNYRISEELKQTKVTVDLRNVPFALALKQINAALPPTMQITEQGGIYSAGN